MTLTELARLDKMDILAMSGHAQYEAAKLALRHLPALLAVAKEAQELVDRDMTYIDGVTSISRTQVLALRAALDALEQT